MKKRNIWFLLFFITVLACQKDEIDITPVSGNAPTISDKTCLIDKHIRTSLITSTVNNVTRDTTIKDTFDVIYDNDDNLLVWNYDKFKKDSVIYEAGLPKFIYSTENSNSGLLEFYYENFYDENSNLVKRVRTYESDIGTIYYRIDSITYNIDNQVDELFQFREVDYKPVESPTLYQKVFEEKYIYYNGLLTRVEGKKYSLSNSNNSLSSTYTERYSQTTSLKNPYYKNVLPDFFRTSLIEILFRRYDRHDSYGSHEWSEWSPSIEGNEHNYPLFEHLIYDCE